MDAVLPGKVRTRFCSGLFHRENMAKYLYIAEKPSVAAEFAKALKLNTRRHNGYVESEEAVFTWCVGHLVTMSYPDRYDPRLKRWSLDTLPFIPDQFLYEIIPSVSKQFEIVKELLHRADISRIYVCTDSGREGEYIYRLVEQMAGVSGKERRRVWIDSQTEEEILRGIQNAKDLSEYDHLSDSAYLRAKEDYLMGINFSRLLTLKYGNTLSAYLRKDRTVISVGRVMTCVLGMVVRREREIRAFVKTPFYRVLAQISLGEGTMEGEWRAVEGSNYFGQPILFKDNGFLKKEDGEAFISRLSIPEPITVTVEKAERRQEKKNPPLLYNLAELQNDCSRMFKISPDETLRIIQELYEKKLVTYPRTDARVLSEAVAKVIDRNLKGLRRYGPAAPFAEEILQKKRYEGLVKSRYVNDRAITDHYAIIPTGQGLSALDSLNRISRQVYQVITGRFLSVFYPPAVYKKVSVVTKRKGETLPKEEYFFSSVRVLSDPGYLQVANQFYGKGKQAESSEENGETKEAQAGEQDEAFLKRLSGLKKGMTLPVNAFSLKEGETTPPKRYNSGTMILAMENAGQLIEDEELRAQIKGSGIGTSATRAEILKKLINNQYMALNKRSQIITPTQLGEMIYDVVNCSIRSLLNPELTASWEKGLQYVANGEITSEEYMEKLRAFICSRTGAVMNLNNQGVLRQFFDAASVYYKK